MIKKSKNQKVFAKNFTRPTKPGRRRGAGAAAPRRRPHPRGPRPPAAMRAPPSPSRHAHTSRGTAPRATRLATVPGATAGSRAPPRAPRHRPPARRSLARSCGAAAGCARATRRAARVSGYCDVFAWPAAWRGRRRGDGVEWAAESNRGTRRVGGGTPLGRFAVRQFKPWVSYAEPRQVALAATVRSPPDAKLRLRRRGQKSFCALSSWNYRSWIDLPGP